MLAQSPKADTDATLRQIAALLDDETQSAVVRASCARNLIGDLLMARAIQALTGTGYKPTIR